MDIRIKLSGLDELLAVIYGNNTSLSGLLGELGFERAQVEQLQAGHLESVVTQFLGVIHKRLTNDAGKDTYYQILSRRYGLDGEPRQRLSDIAEAHKYSPEYVHQLFEQIIHRCQSKTWQKELKKSLTHIAVCELGNMNRQPTHNDVAEKLKRLSHLRDAIEFSRLDYETKRKEILKQIQPELDALEAEYKPVLENAEENVGKLEQEIKTDVLLYGESVSAGMYRASYTQGRTSWDNEGMTKYAALHPDVLQFRKQGQPIVSIRVVNRD